MKALSSAARIRCSAGTTGTAAAEAIGAITFWNSCYNAVYNRGITTAGTAASSQCCFQSRTWTPTRHPTCWNAATRGSWSWTPVQGWLPSRTQSAPSVFHSASGWLASGFSAAGALQRKILGIRRSLSTLSSPPSVSGSCQDQVCRRTFWGWGLWEFVVGWGAPVVRVIAAGSSPLVRTAWFTDRLIIQ